MAACDHDFRSRAVLFRFCISGAPERLTRDTATGQPVAPPVGGPCVLDVDVERRDRRFGKITPHLRNATASRKGIRTLIFGTNRCRSTPIAAAIAARNFPPS